MVLAAIIVLLAGVCVWGVFGNLETVADTVAVSRDGQVICYVKKADTATVSVGTTVKIGGEEHLVTQLATAPVAAIDELLPYGMAIGGFEGWDLAYEAVLDGTLPDGTYPAKVVLERVAPMSFLWG